MIQNGLVAFCEKALNEKSWNSSSNVFFSLIETLKIWFVISETSRSNFDVSLRSPKAKLWRKKVNMYVYQSVSLVKLNTMRLSPALYLVSVRSCKPKDSSDLHDLKWHWKRSLAQIAPGPLWFAWHMIIIMFYNDWWWNCRCDAT